MPRAFVAVDLDPVDRLALHRLQLQLQLGTVATDGWLAADDLHLTLRFFGDIDDTCTAGITRRCAALAATALVSAAWSQTLEAWPPERPRVLVLTLAVEPALAALQRETMAMPPAATRDGRPWRPHITLRRARCADFAQLPAVPSLPAAIRCHRLALFARAGTDAPLRYRRLGTWPLQATASAPG